MIIRSLELHERDRMKATLSLTHKCNLGCRYCYAGKAVKEDMSLATAQKIVDFAMESGGIGQRVEFGFFGGEPLLRFDLIKDIVAYIRSKEQKAGCRAILSITSNGTLLNQTMLDFFKAEDIQLCISIDGPAGTHDLNRIQRSGAGSFTLVEKGLRMAMDSLDSVQVNAVYGPETIDSLPQTVAFFTDMRVPFIHLNPNIRSTWPEELQPRLSQICMDIAEHYIQCYQRGQEIAVNLIDSKLMLFLKDGYGAEDKCGMGETEWGFAPSGNIYPCERFIGEDDDLSMCIGNIHTGFDTSRRCVVLAKKGNRNEECARCGLSKYCMNWCGCTNHFMTGRSDMASSMLCALERATINAAKHVLTTLSQSDNELFTDHLMRYLCKGRTTINNQQNGGLVS